MWVLRRRLGAKAALAGVPVRGLSTGPLNVTTTPAYLVFDRAPYGAHAINFRDHFDAAFDPLATPSSFVGSDELLVNAIAVCRDEQIPLCKWGWVIDPIRVAFHA